MCDFRNIIAVKINGETTIISKNRGYFSGFHEITKELSPGLYSVGASGVGQYYYDGKSWYSDYECNLYNPTKVCEFIVEGHDE